MSLTQGLVGMLLCCVAVTCRFGLSDNYEQPSWESYPCHWYIVILSQEFDDKFSHLVTIIE